MKRNLLDKMKTHPSFYQKVWLACARIPRGKTRTYGEIARIIGRPGAARAVGRALAANPFAPAIPCHRVVGAGGAMVGYSAPGGIQKKRRLLLQEAGARSRRRLP